MEAATQQARPTSARGGRPRVCVIGAGSFYPYMRTIRRERKRARGGLAGVIARRSHELRLGSPG